MLRSSSLAGTAIGVVVCSGVCAGEFTLEPAFPNLQFDQPITVRDPFDGTDRMFVVERAGRVHVFDNDPAETDTQIFLDLTDVVSDGMEEGILGLAFHPDFAENGWFYIAYTVADPDLTSVVSHFKVSEADPNVADEVSEVVLLKVPQPWWNHNVYHLEFGPDGYLYIGCGDGGTCCNLMQNGQDPTTLLGSVLRIDVDTASDGRNYSIPPDNPFASNGKGYKEEIFVWGLRNPYRFSFDATGRFWLTDVGLHTWEEINWGQAGANYGWATMEGAHCHMPPQDCNTTGLALPIWEYPHEFSPNGGVSITGGHVYQGTSFPQLRPLHLR